MGDTAACWASVFGAGAAADTAGRGDAFSELRNWSAVSPSDEADAKSLALSVGAALTGFAGATSIPANAGADFSATAGPLESDGFCVGAATG
jgi:hypothetical protein